MQIVGFLILVLTIATPIITSPIPLFILGDADKVAAGQQSCKARLRGLVVNYSIHIGAPFSQEKCDAAIHRLQTNGGLPSSIKCYSDGDGATCIKINNLPGQSTLINEAHNATWEGIGLNCPDY